MKIERKHLNLLNAITIRGLSGGCHDLLPEERAMLTFDEWVEFCRAYHEWNGDPEVFDPKRPIMQDFAVVNFIQAKAMKNLFTEGEDYWK